MNNISTKQLILGTNFLTSSGNRLFVNNSGVIYQSETGLYLTGINGRFISDANGSYIYDQSGILRLTLTNSRISLYDQFGNDRFNALSNGTTAITDNNNIDRYGSNIWGNFIADQNDIIRISVDTGAVGLIDTTQVLKFAVQNNHTYAYDNSGSITTDLLTRQLSGNWSVQNLKVSGQSVTTGGPYLPYNSGANIVSKMVPLSGDFTQQSKNFPNVSLSNSSTISSGGLGITYDNQLIFGCSSLPFGSYIGIGNHINPDSSYIFVQTPDITFSDPYLYTDGFASFSSANKMIYLGDYFGDNNNTYLSLNDNSSQININANTINLTAFYPIQIGDLFQGILTNTQIYVKTSTINFKNSGNYNIGSIPIGYIFLIDAMECVTTDVVSPNQAPYISFGNTFDMQAYHDTFQTTSNSKLSRHILDEPQDGIEGNTSLTVSIISPSTAASHSGYFAFKGFLTKV